MQKKKIDIPLFVPLVNDKMKQAAYKELGQRIIGQGKTIDTFERKLGSTLGIKNIVSTNSATSALELAYFLSDLKSGDEVISPVFTCTATNIPLARRGVKIVFADIKEDLLIDWDDVEKKITPKTKAIINVHLFDQQSRPRKLSVPIIGDSAQCLNKTSNERFTVYSFQATKIITTVDGGALVCENYKDYKRARLLRWYGIDRETGKSNIDVDIKEAGFRYNMTNVDAAIGLAALNSLNQLKNRIKVLQKLYFDGLKNVSQVKLIGGSPFLIHTKYRGKLIDDLADKGVEAGLVHKRNDIYTVFGGRRQNLPNMNKYERTYLLLPCRDNMTAKDVDYICGLIKKICQ